MASTSQEGVSLIPTATNLFQHKNMSFKCRVSAHSYTGLNKLSLRSKLLGQVYSLNFLNENYDIVMRIVPVESR